MKTISALLFALTVVFVSGCNTVAGAGQDVKDAGQSVQNAAERNK